ncbi:MAG TPA: prepilin-type N-terminal cleavage/methylation domain-containing protein [Gemmataceae bacterium]|nr:prepilin-type N-terminal cleavage/methylation domain-containing protein [Gemmataceae bacterium]
MKLQPHFMSRSTRLRPGFSLIELMIVIAIIGVIVSLAASATMQVISRQRSANTELTIQKVNDALKAHWRAVVDQAKTEDISSLAVYPGLLAMAGNDPSSSDCIRRARVIWIYLRLKQQFPMNFMEALNPVPIRSIASPGPAPAFQALLGKPASPTPQMYESSVCLLLALSQSRKGVPAFNEDRLSSIEKADAGTFNAAMTGLKAIVDAWGRPLVFYRWPIGGEVAASNPNAATSSQLIADPLDPEGLLMNPTWNNAAAYGGRQGVWAFEKMFHPIHVGSGNSYKPTSYYTVPVVASAGPTTNPALNNQSTVYQLMGLPPPQELPPLAMPTLPPALLHDPMNLAAGTSDSQDNIYSFRMRVGARGD